jgi:hypothetical protein
VEFPFKVRASETDLLEDTIGTIGKGRTMKFSMLPWEIKTVRLARVDETR